MNPVVVSDNTTINKSKVEQTTRKSVLPSKTINSTPMKATLELTMKSQKTVPMMMHNPVTALERRAIV